MMNCQWQMGMLVPHGCGAPAVSGCSLCGVPICAAHTVPGMGKGPACPSCASANDGYEDTEDTEFVESRDSYYEEYGGEAAFGTDGYFTASEGAMLRQEGASQNLAPEDPDAAAEEYDHLDT